MNKNKTLGKTEKKILIISSIAVLLTFIIGASFAFIAYSTRQKGINVLETNCINVTMEELTNEIRLKNAYPVTDEVGANLKPFRFKLTNTCGIGVDYDLNLEVMGLVNEKSEDNPQGTVNRIASKNIATKVDELEKVILNPELYPEKVKTATPTYNQKSDPAYDNEDYTAVEAYTIYSGSIEPYDSITHEVRIWLDASAGNDSQNGSFYSKIIIEAIQNQVVEYKESILNGAEPVLVDNLIPVEIDNTGKVTKASIYSEWYSYAEKRWANAVILSDKTINYNKGQEIPEENIESYFVWIPKYSYQLWDLGKYDELTSTDNTKPHVIPIKFGLNNTNDANDGECTTPGWNEETKTYNGSNVSGESDNCKIGDYMTHPAFLSMGTNGIWVGKFETGYKGDTAPGNVNNSSLVQIKPNVYSWKNIQISNMFYTSYNYQRDLDSHMMKNTEWGSVAYLQHSAYGSATSVRINNNSAYITGYAAVNEPATGYTGTNIAGNIYESTSLGVDGTNTYNYKNTASQVASTTGNYTGIYDLSGGAWEYTSAYMSGQLGRSGFTANTITPYAKYIDVYSASSTQESFQYRILGDATGEFGPFANKTYGDQTRPTGSWYTDEGWFVSNTYPWFLRGGSYPGGLGAGIFDFSRNNGAVDTRSGFRLVLAV